MLVDFFSNLGVITALLFFTSQVFKKIDHYIAAMPVRSKVFGGFIDGIYGVIIMFFGLHVPPNILFDLRHIFILIAANFGGALGAMVAAIVIATGRILFFGGINPSSIAAIADIFVVAIAAGVIFEFKRTNYWTKWLVSLSVLLITIISRALWLLDSATAVLILTNFIPVVIVAGICVATLLRFLVRSNQLFLQREIEATTDFLTGLNNVRSFDSIFNEIAKSASAREENLSCLMIDIDDFKKVNDNYGHNVGDEVLRQVSNVLKDSARSFDVVSRNGGEEFSILLPDCPKNYSAVVAEKIRRTLEKHTFRLPDGTDLQLTVSIGVANYPDVPMDSLIISADKALYEAKYSGRNRICKYKKVLNQLS